MHFVAQSFKNSENHKLCQQTINFTMARNCNVSDTSGPFDFFVCQEKNGMRAFTEHASEPRNFLKYNQK